MAQQIQTYSLNRRGKRTAPPSISTGIGRLNDVQRRKTQEINKAIRKFFQGPSIDIQNIGFRLFSWEELVNGNRVRIANINDGNYDSINSVLTGTSDYNSHCRSCHGSIDTCPGHFGIIEFAEPIVHPARYFVTDIVNILKSVCSTCGSLVLARNTVRDIVANAPQDESRRLALIAKRSEAAETCYYGTNCVRMREIKSEIVDNIAHFYYNGKKRTPITARMIYNIFNSISNEDAELLGFKGGSHPRNLVLFGIPVIPPCSRPPTMTESGELKSSVLTELYRRVIEANNELARSTATVKDTRKLSAAVYNLMFRGPNDHTMTDNISIKVKITDKYNGVIRGQILGKNIINSGRSVVVCDPTLRFGEIGFPRELARRMTVTETVTESNISRLNMYLRRGLITKYRPLSNPVKSIYEITIMDKNRYSTVLQPGDLVERQLMDGDYVLSFRQPVLTKLSMLGNRIRLREGYTFACHMAETTARNMDFDGDEVNVHAPTDIEAMNQVANYVSSRMNIMDPRNNMVAMAVVYDGLISIYLMMMNPEKPSVEEFRDLLSVITNKTDLITLGQRASALGVTDLISYRMVFSALLPAGLYYKKNDVVIVDGILLEGIIGKNHIGHARDTIIQQILLDFGDQRAADFITDVYFLLTRYLSRRGFSVGYKDTLIDESVRQHINEELDAMSAQILLMTSQSTNEMERRYTEKRIIDVISNYTERLFKYNKDNAPQDNRFVTMIDSGAKGKNAEFGTMTAFVGQRYSQGTRMKMQLTDNTRASIYYRPGDNSPSARGFVMHSYTEGLTPQEVIFNQINARDDIVVMMMGTPDTGSLSHQMTRVLENVRTRDGNIVNPDGRLVQPMYGGDGMDAERMTAVRTPMGHVNTFANLRRIVGRLNAARGAPNTEAEGVREDVEYAEEDEIEHAMEVYEELEY